MLQRSSTFRHLIKFTMRLLAAAGTALVVTTYALPAQAQDVLVQSITIKWNESAVADSSVTIPDQARAALSQALRQGVVQLGRTRDGAFRLGLSSPLSEDEARAAINRVRMALPVVYASAHAPTDPGHAMATQTPVTVTQQPPVRRLIVKYRDADLTRAAIVNGSLSLTQTDRLSALAGQPVAHERAMSGGAFVVRLFQALPVDQARSLAAYIASDPTVEYAEPDFLKQPLLVPNDPSYASQWHYYEAAGGVNLPTAWNSTTGSASILVAVIDTGSLPDHPDLAGRYIGGYDMISDALVGNDGDLRDADPSDPGDWITAGESVAGFFQGCTIRNSSWHGTHVAGTIGAASNNNVGVAGINWIGKIVPVRALGKCGGYTSDIADSIRWAAGLAVPGVPDNPNPARVMNLSLGGDACDNEGNCTCDTASQLAVTDAVAAGAVVVVAAGNSSSDARISAPGNCNGVITVGATGRQGQRASYSNFGPLVEISAPGGSDGQGVLSTLNNGAQSPNPFGYVYQYYQGTSMATPHVAGIASLLLSAKPSLTPAQVLAVIQTTARAFPVGTVRDCSTTGTFACGAGIIDAGAAVASVMCSGDSAMNSDLVEHYYAAILHRPSDAGGKASWTSEADRLCALGADPKQTFVVMANVFFNTPEYLALNRDNNGFVTDLYITFFGRLPEAGGFSYWVGQLSSGIPRNNVMSSFLFSAEFTTTMNGLFPGQTARAETYLVLNLYGGLFRRLAETAGYTYWTGQFRTAQCNATPAAAVQAAIDSVSSQFLASAEYALRATTNSQYVVDLYYALLQRGAETAGYNYWVGQLNGSFLSRGQVRQQFLTSPEMQAQSAAIAAQGCSS